jgi:pyruvate-ferredoxin/flavodoxin oxidoreductase
VARELLQLAQEDVQRQWSVYSNRAAMPGNGMTPGHVASNPAVSTPQPVTAGEKK